MPEAFIKTTHYTKYLPNELSQKIVNMASLVVFDEREIICDEGVSYKRGKIDISSYRYGLVKWDSKKRQYVHHYHFSERNLGQLKYILIEGEA